MLPPPYVDADASAPSIDLPTSASPSSASPAPPPPSDDLPDYATVPSLRAERLFWFGFAWYAASWDVPSRLTLTSPLLWIIGTVGLLGLGREDPLRAAGFRRSGKHASPSPSLEEAGIGDEARWRFAREERKWHRRSCRALITTFLLAALIALVIVFVVVLHGRLFDTAVAAPAERTAMSAAPVLVSTSAIRAVAPAPTGPPGGALHL